MRKLFGTDGIRGVANVYPMTIEIAMQVGRAIAFIVKDKAKGHRIVIGKDTRQSCYMLENALAAGICSMGVDVLLVGPLPTPGIAFITTSMRADAGVVISASHNPFQDNQVLHRWLQDILPLRHTEPQFLRFAETLRHFRSDGLPEALPLLRPRRSGSEL